MSKVVASYDTETKELTLVIDGVTQPEVENVSISSYTDEESPYGYFEASFKTVEQNGVRYRLSAHGSKIEKTDKIEEYVRDILLKKKPN